MYTGGMTLDTLIMLAGAFVATLPFLGFPNSWDSALLFIAGVLIIGLGIIVRRNCKNLDVSNPAPRESHFVEHMPRPQNEHGQS